MLEIWVLGVYAFYTYKTTTFAIFFSRRLRGRRIPRGPAPQALRVLPGTTHAPADDVHRRLPRSPLPVPQRAARAAAPARLQRHRHELLTRGALRRDQETHTRSAGHVQSRQQAEHRSVHFFFKCAILVEKKKTVKR